MTTNGKHGTEWPPRGWPNCPESRRLQAAIDHIEADMERFQPMIETAVHRFLKGRRIAILTCRRAPSGIRNDVETMLAELAARSAAMMIDHDAAEQPGMPAQHPLQFFLRAARLSTHTSIGMVVLKRLGDETPIIAYGVMHRDEDWAGLCPVLGGAGGLEALIFCDQTHEPDAIMMIPRDILGCDPGELGSCGLGEEIAGIPVNRTLMGIFRHHGCNPHLVDICNRSEMERSLERLFMNIPGEEDRNDS